MANMTTMMLDSYDALESTLTQMKNINLASFPGENVSDFCTWVVVDMESLDSSGELNTEHFFHKTLYTWLLPTPVWHKG